MRRFRSRNAERSREDAVQRGETAQINGDGEELKIEGGVIQVPRRWNAGLNLETLARRSKQIFPLNISPGVGVNKCNAV